MATSPMRAGWYEELREEASLRLEPNVFDWLVGGSGREESLHSAHDAWSEVRLLPDAGFDVTEVDLSTSVLGRRVEAPVAVAPTGFHRLLHPEAEAATAAACADLGLLFTLSSRASCRLDQAAVPNAPWWFQPYVMRDRGLTAALATRAVELGAAALVLTVDAAVLPARRRSRDEGLVDRSTMTVNAPGVEDLALLEPSPAVTPDDVRWLGDLAGLPVVVKGLVRPDTALRFIDAGAAAVWVSTHGGRQLDGAIAPARALPSVVEAVGDRAEVYVDGGVHSGVDVLRALALGARAAFVGRAPLYGLVSCGRSGVATVLQALVSELHVALHLAGRPRVADVGQDLVWRAS